MFSRYRVHMLNRPSPRAADIVIRPYRQADRLEVRRIGNRIPGVQVRVNQIVERLELVGNLLRQNRAKLFGHDVGGTACKT